MLGGADSRSPIIPWVSGLQFSVKLRLYGFTGREFQDLKDFMGSMFQGYQRAKGFRVSMDRGFPLADRGVQRVWHFQNPRVSGKILLTGAFKGYGVSKIQRLQGPRDEGFQGSKVQGLKG